MPKTRTSSHRRRCGHFRYEGVGLALLGAVDRADECRSQTCAVDFVMPGPRPAPSGRVMRNSKPTGETDITPVRAVLAAWAASLVLRVDNMKTSLSGREPLNAVAEPGPDLLEIDIFDFR